MRFSENVINGDTQGVFDMSKYDEFDTEEEAIDFAFENGKWSTWTIIPLISFDNF